ncbi:MAG: MG2 domain-containing protein, partial [Anaerolineae bacterium]|nr:MG2 domain-containing protein [Anaerolineae bacterium]
VVEFRTAPPPAVLRIGGRNENTPRVVAYFESVQVEFQGLIDPESIQDKFTVTDDGKVVDVNVWWNTYEAIPTAYISWDKTPGAEYCVTVEPGIRDLYGHTIDEPVRTCLTGGDLPSAFSAVSHRDSLSLDAAEPARLYFVGVNTTLVNFTLARLTDTGFIDYENQLGEVLARWTLNTAGERNKFDTLPVDLEVNGSPLPTGYYQLTWNTNTDRRGPSRMRIAVVDQHVTLKMAEDEALVWVTGLRSGLPIANVPVRVLSHTGVELGSGTTDADGVARFPVNIPGERWDTYLAVSGEPGGPGFGVARSDWDQDVGPWNFDVAASYWRAPSFRLYLHTDRPIYRPGQSVNFRGIVRTDEDAVYSLPPAGTQVSLKFYDAYHDLIDERIMDVSDSGMFDGQFILPVDGRLGSYSINAEIVDEAESGTSVQYTVAAYRKPEFEVAVSPSLEAILKGNESQVLVKAQYYAGGAVNNARLHWTVSAEPYIYNPDIPGWWHWGFDRLGWEWWREPEVIAEGDGFTDASGQFMWTWPAELQQLGDQDRTGPQNWQLEVTVTDEAGMPVTGRGEWVIHPGAFYIGLKPRSWVAYAGKTAEVDLLTLDLDGASLPEQTFRVQLARRTWEMVPATEPYASPEWIYTDEIEETQRVVTDQAGKAVVPVTPSQSGSYVVIAESTDQGGNVIRSETYLWVAGAERAAWQQPENQVKPVADAGSYRSGDVARILLPTSFTAPYEVLMTVERAGILQAERFTIQESSPVIEVPIGDSFIPNVIVSFVAVKGIGPDQTTPDVRIGMVDLAVEPTEKLVTVEITPDCQGPDGATCTYAPGDEAVIDIRTYDHRGAPVAA